MHFCRDLIASGHDARSTVEVLVRSQGQEQQCRSSSAGSRAQRGTSDRSTHLLCCCRRQLEFFSRCISLCHVIDLKGTTETLACKNFAWPDVRIVFSELMCLRALLVEFLQRDRYHWWCTCLDSSTKSGAGDGKQIVVASWQSLACTLPENSNRFITTAESGWLQRWHHQLQL